MLDNVACYKHTALNAYRHYPVIQAVVPDVQYVRATPLQLLSDQASASDSDTYYKYNDSPLP